MSLRDSNLVVIFLSRFLSFFRSLPMLIALFKQPERFVCCVILVCVFWSDARLVHLHQPFLRKAAINFWTCSSNSCSPVESSSSRIWSDLSIPGTRLKDCEHLLHYGVTFTPTCLLMCRFSCMSTSSAACEQTCEAFSHGKQELGNLNHLSAHLDEILRCGCGCARACVRVRVCVCV